MWESSETLKFFQANLTWFWYPWAITENRNILIEKCFEDTRVGKVNEKVEQKSDPYRQMLCDNSTLSLNTEWAIGKNHFSLKIFFPLKKPCNTCSITKKKKKLRHFLNCFSQFFILIKLFPMNVSKTSRKKFSMRQIFIRSWSQLYPNRLKKK